MAREPNAMHLCPLFNKKIEAGTCYDISMVAEKMAPRWSAPKEATKIDEFEKICLGCKNHQD
ncbi:MAG: hypothetical protein RSC99_10545 [Clostridiales bacterium]